MAVSDLQAKHSKLGAVVSGLRDIILKSRLESLMEKYLASVRSVIKQYSNHNSVAKDMVASKSSKQVNYQNLYNSLFEGIKSFEMKMKS